MNESDIQKAVFAELRSRGMPGIVYWHCPNDPSSRRKSGYLAGAPDVMILHRGEFFALELKTEKGNPSVEQMECIDRINAADGFAFCAKGLPVAVACLESWGVLRRAA